MLFLLLALENQRKRIQIYVIKKYLIDSISVELFFFYLGDKFEVTFGNSFIKHENNRGEYNRTAFYRNLVRKLTCMKPSNHLTKKSLGL